MDDVELNTKSGIISLTEEAVVLEENPRGAMKRDFFQNKLFGSISVLISVFLVLGFVLNPEFYPRKIIAAIFTLSLGYIIIDRLFLSVSSTLTNQTEVAHSEIQQVELESGGKIRGGRAFIVVNRNGEEQVRPVHMPAVFQASDGSIECLEEYFEKQEIPVKWC